MKTCQIDIGVLLGAMILKHFENEEKINELMEEINMKQISDEIKIIARDEFKEEFEKIEKEKQELQLENIEVKKENTEMKKENTKVKKENTKVKKENTKVKKENTEMKKENGKLKDGLKQLNEIKDLTPEAKKIINSLMVN